MHDERTSRRSAVRWTGSERRRCHLRFISWKSRLPRGEREVRASRIPFFIVDTLFCTLIRAGLRDVQCNVCSQESRWWWRASASRGKLKVLTEILSDVQQNFRGSSVQLIKQGAEAEEEQRSHAETITPQGESQRYRRECAVLSVVSLSNVVGSLAVAVKWAAAEILHHLLLTKRRGKSAIRLWNKWNVSLPRPFEADAQFSWRRAGTPLSSTAAATGLLLCAQRSARARPLSSALVGWVLLPSFLPAELRVHPSAQESFGCQVTERRKEEQLPPHTMIWFGLPRVKQRHQVFVESKVVGKLSGKRWMYTFNFSIWEKWPHPI